MASNPPARSARWKPTVGLLLLAPFFGEGLSGSTPPLELLLPWNLALMVALYGCGAVLCREATRRFTLGVPGLVILGAAYGVLEEGLIDRFWYYPNFWNESGVGSYSVVGQTNVLLAVHLTVFHSIVSITCPVLLVERVFTGQRDRPWVGRVGLVICGALLVVVVPFVYGELDRRPSLPVLLGVVGLLLLLVAAALWSGRWHTVTRAARTRRRPRALSGITFVCVLAHWVVVYSVAETGVPWGLGVAASLVPVALGALVAVRAPRDGPYGEDSLRLITGVLAFFVLLDVGIGLTGRYDLILGGLAVAAGLVWLRRRETAAAPRLGQSGGRDTERLRPVGRGLRRRER